MISEYVPIATNSKHTIIHWESEVEKNQVEISHGMGSSRDSVWKIKIKKQKEILWKLHDAKLEYRKVSDKIQHALMIQTQKTQI